jgi:ion channel-forming bestrophin family protein
MINYNPKSWISLIFNMHKSDTLSILWKELLYMGAFTLAIAYVEINFFSDYKNLEKLISVYSLIGFVISLLLVFRTNTAYERWWEGRKKWGELVNDSRNFALKLNAILNKQEDKDFFARLISNFVFATKEHLRSGVIFEELELSDSEKELLITKNHIPLELCNQMYHKIFSLKRSGQITEEEFIVLDKNINAFMDSCGACERIKKTPIPYSYSLFFKKFIFIYVTTLPLAFVSSFGYWSALIATFIFYVLVSIEVLAEEIEDPFGLDANDLPTDEIAKNIKASVDEVLGKSLKTSLE